MIDIRILRDHPDLVKAAAKNKNASVSSEDIDHLLKLDVKRRELTTIVEDVRRERNELSDGLKKGKPSPEQIEAGKKLKRKLAELEAEYAGVDEDFSSF